MAKLKILKPFSGYVEGQEIGVEVDNDGVPTNQFWRNRLKDSERDGCVELVKASKKRKVTKPEPEGSHDADAS